MIAEKLKGSEAVAANYIEDVFSTYLYTGNGSTQTITNGIDLAGKGGLVWLKDRTSAYSNFLVDTARGTSKWLVSNTTAAQANPTWSSASFLSNGFQFTDNYTGTNSSSQNYASWTFRKQPKFFDVVTYTGDGTNRTIAHNLGVAPGMIITKRTDVDGDGWAVYHSGTGASAYLVLNDTDASTASGTGWNATAPTASVFSLGTSSLANANGGTYVAYLFAHNAGGFGPNGTDNVISCGSFTATNPAAQITLGYEPQWLLVKRTDSSVQGDWVIYDNMRGFWASPTGNAPVLRPNLSNAELAGWYDLHPNSTGFDSGSLNTGNYIYIAIRRGPMKVPTDGTKVFSPSAGTYSSGTAITTNFPVDLLMQNIRTGNFDNTDVIDRLRGVPTTDATGGAYLTTSATSAETATSNHTRFWTNTGYSVGGTGAGNNTAYFAFRRAPGFFDVVAYTGDGAGPRTIPHQLGAVPQLMIVKSRSSATNGDWAVYASPLGNTASLAINSTSNAPFGGQWVDTTPTSSVFTVDGTGSSRVNASTKTYVAYLFASCPGVSKVGSYTGNGSSQTINCGFTGGARFVLIKRTDSTGDWYVWDAARGMVSGTDPSLLLNSTAAEVNANSIYTATGGFQIVSTAAGINASGGTFIYLAIA